MRLAKISSMSLVYIFGMSITSFAYTRDDNPKSSPKDTVAPSAQDQNRSIIHAPSTGLNERMTAAVQPSNELEDQARELLHLGDIKGAEKVCAESIRRSVRAEGKIWNTSALQLMGEILIRQGRNREAVGYLNDSFNFNGAGVTAHLDLAIAHCRLKEYRNALPHYSDRTVLEPIEDVFPRSFEYLPGTRSLRSLEASALLARGVEDYYSRGSDWALGYLSEAERLVPHNRLIEHFVDECLLDHRLPIETIKRYAQQSPSKPSYLATAARERLARIEAWHKLKHTEAKQNDAPPYDGN
jgi:tetratricopeptide (TPR) repeat protein